MLALKFEIMVNIINLSQNYIMRSYCMGIFNPLLKPINMNYKFHVHVRIQYDAI